MSDSQIRNGTYFRFELPDGTFGYSRCVDFPYFEVYATRTVYPVDSLGELVVGDVQFTIAVRVAELDEWHALGWRDIDANGKVPAVFFHQDRFDPSDCTIYDTASNERSANPAECVGLERGVVWRPVHIAERLHDELRGVVHPAVVYYQVELP